MTKFISLSVIVFLIAFPVFAAPTAVDASADQTMEWHRKDGYVILRGNAVITRGSDTLRAPEITAYLAKGSASKIDHVVATGGMELVTANGIATGPNGTYNLQTETAQLTGTNLQLKTADATITAQKEIDYNRVDGTLTAIGSAEFMQGTDTIKADTITAFFATDPVTGKNVLVKASGVGNLVLVTPKETLTADKGDYMPGQNKALVWGNVKIQQGENTLEGARGEVNLTTDVSTLYGGNGTETGRVKGVFFTD